MAIRMDYWLARTLIDMSQNTVTGYRRVKDSWVNVERPNAIYRLTHARVERLKAAGLVRAYIHADGYSQEFTYIKPTLGGLGRACATYGRHLLRESKRMLEKEARDDDASL